jgi:succinate-semialdehyde dehydrogenase / glutarate-semialdehyde dehydrogenase
MSVGSVTMSGLAQEVAASQWSAAEGRFEVTAPATGEVIATVPDCGPVEARAAADAVCRGFEDWKRTTAFDRAAVMHRWFDLIAARRDDIAELIAVEVGKPIRQARGEVDYANAFISWNADESLRRQGEILASSSTDQRVFVLQQPVGPAFGITPWNFPAAMVTRTVAPAIAAGCTMVLKPAEQSPLTSLVLAHLWREAGGPAEVFQVVPCRDPRPVAGALLDDERIRKLTFTGSHAIGKVLYRQSADTMKSISLELGGHAPFIVFADADIQAAAAEAIKCKFRYSGQTCVCTNRIYVHASIAEEFTDAYVQLASDLRVGDPLDESTDIGPLIDEQGKDKVLRHVSDAKSKGAVARVGGGDRDGLYFDPTVLTGVDDSMAVMQEETFGPVAPITVFDTDDEVIRRANDTEFGLAAYYWTRDVSRVFRLATELEVGIIGCNDGVPGGSAHVPFGGVKQSGIGRAGGRWGLEEYLEPKYVSLRLPGVRSI